MASAMPDLDILSADSFPDTAPVEIVHASSHGSSPVLPLGIVIYPDGDRSNMSAEQPQPGSKHTQSKRSTNKRARSGADADADSATKKRGRPRVDTRDETASERRRTQIRLAQRAYRLRKESVISSLHQRVEELEKTVENMSEAFLAFNDEAMSSGVLSSHPQLAQLFRSTTQRFLSLAKVASPDPSHEDDDSDMGARDGAPTPPENDQDRSGSSYEAQSTATRKTTSEVGVDRTNHANQSMEQPGYEILPASIPQFSSDPEWSYLDSLFNAGVDRLDLKLPPSLGIPQTALSFSPYTYSFQETTFARRLHRRCIELGHALLTSPACNPNYIQKKFNLTLSLATRNQLANAFQFLLQRKAGEPLEFWNKPYFYFGGAGTHFPRKDEFGNVVYPPNMHPPERALGPLCIHQGETSQPHQNVEELIEAAGFGGVWFDCNDVEGYAASKGIHLDSSATYVEVPAASTIYAPSGYESPSSMTHDSFDPDVGSLPAQGEDPILLSSDMASFGSQLFSPPCAQETLRFLGIDSETLSLSQTDPQNMRIVETVPKQTSVMDVDRFINELIKRGVCLGRAPGFRQQDVDAALQVSIVNSQ